MSEQPIRVLLVNDQPEVCRLWQHLLAIKPDMECVGYALDGKQGVAMTRQYQPDVVVMDVMMPDMNGYDATRQILTELPETQVIIYSAYSGKADEAYMVGAVEFLMMPIMPDELIDTIRQVIARRDAKHNKARDMGQEID